MLGAILKPILKNIVPKLQGVEIVTHGLHKDNYYVVFKIHRANVKPVLGFAVSTRYKRPEEVPPLTDDLSTNLSTVLDIIVTKTDFEKIFNYVDIPSLIGLVGDISNLKDDDAFINFFMKVFSATKGVRFEVEKDVPLEFVDESGDIVETIAINIHVIDEKTNETVMNVYIFLASDDDDSQQWYTQIEEALTNYFSKFNQSQ